MADADLTGRTIIVTGATSGLGRASAHQLAARGARVVIAARSVQRGADTLAAIRDATGNTTLELLPVDLGSLASVRRAAAEFRAGHDRLDVLMNNAGISPGPRRETADGFEETFATNVLGPALLTLELLPLLRTAAPSRIVDLSSSVHFSAKITWDDVDLTNGYNQFQAYRQSKLANALWTFVLARRLEGTGVTANAVHPGVVGTALFRNLPLGLGGIAARILPSAEKQARTQVWAAVGPDLDGVTGQYLAGRKIAQASAVARDVANQDRLYDLVLSRIGVPDPFAGVSVH